MTYPAIKTRFRIGIATSMAIILFQVSNILLVYRFFRFEYYITAVAILFLIAGFFVSKYQQKQTTAIVQPKNQLADLTARELQILAMVADGKSNKEIAAINFVEVTTVKTHINNIYSKLNIKNRREAISLFIKNRNLN